MKRIICLIISLVMLLLALASCAPAATTEATTGTASPEAKTLENVKLDGFYGTVAEVSENMITVSVSEEYKNALGETVQVTFEGTQSLRIIKNDQLHVYIESISEGKPFSATAKSIQVTRAADGRQPFESQFMERYHLIHNNIIEIPKTFPELSGEELNLELTKEKWQNGICRIAKIKNGIVYLAEPDEETVCAAIIGIPDFTYTAGDMAYISCSKVYAKPGSQYDIVYKNDVTLLSPMSQDSYRNHIESQYPIDKPVIYLYPEEETKVSVKVNIDGKLTCTYPEHSEGGWQNFTAKPDGTLLSPDGREYYCLYWEGLADMTPDFSRGFCVKGEDTAEFLADILPKIGLSAREANEFIIYWLPILQKNEYNLISFQSEAYTNAAGLEITPAPDSLLRVFMAAKPLTAPVEIAPQEFAGFRRSGFTVVEWGGGMIN